MLFWILIVVMIAAYIWYRNDDCNELAMGAMLAGILANIISVFILICLNVGVDGNVAENKVRYDFLTYQYENNIYDNDNDLGKRELMVDIQDWNEDLAGLKENQRDFWIGIYIPNIYDQFDFIEYGGE